MTDYVKKVLLLNKNTVLRANALVNMVYAGGQINNGDLLPWFVKLEWENTGISRSNTAVLTLRLDHVNTFLSNGPIFFDQNAKNNYLIEIQLTQPSGAGAVFRGTLGEPSLQEDKDIGAIIVITLYDIAYIAKEHASSENYYFLTPKEYFENVLTDYNGNRGGGVILNPQTIDLPADEQLRQNWLPFEPTKTHDLLASVIDRLANPTVAGGTFTDYYFDFVPDDTFTLQSNVVAQKFGEQNSGVIINPILLTPQASEEEKTTFQDNLRYKNHCILLCHPAGGSLPMSHARFASYFEHAKIRPEWSSSGVYVAATATQNASLVKYTNLGEPDPNKRVRFFKCIQNVGPSGTPPPSDPTHWQEDFSTNPSSPAYINYTPWTSSLDDWQANMAAAFGNAPAGYAGFFVDWNIARALYDPNSRTDPLDYYKTLSIKFVTRISNSPPSGAELYNGQKILVGPSPTGAFAGHANQIAEVDGIGPVSFVWRFSNPPTVGDTVHNLEKGTVLKWNGTSWQIVWGDNAGTPVNYDKASPFHIVENLGLVTGATGIPNSAIEATYRWVGPTLGGNIRNNSARGAWLSFFFPYPRLATIHGGIGHEYGGDGSNPPPNAFLNTDNLNRNRKGIIGWNRGLDSEDMGRISAIVFKLRVSLYTSSNDTDLVSFIADIPMTFWAIDKFDRVFFYDFKLRRNGQWDLVRIPIGSLAPKNLYVSRGDELPKLLGYTLPWDFTLPEKEYTGVAFDWRFVKAFGVQMKQSYSETGFYKEAQDAGLNQTTTFIQQSAANVWNAIADPISQALFKTPTKVNILVNHSKIAIDELYFEKQLIVNSDDTEITNPRTTIEHLETETDYLNAKQRAQGIKARLSFFPQFWHIRAIGDARLRFGQRFTIQGNRVPNNQIELVCSSVKHIIDHDGYNMEVLGVKKFETSG
jgi:hypothetical protein